MGSYLNEICAILFRTLQDPFHNIRIAFHLISRKVQFYDILHGTSIKNAFKTTFK